MSRSNSQKCRLLALGLVADLAKAFAQTRAPSGIEAVDGDLDEAGDYWNVRSFFAGRHWTQIEPLDLLRRYPGGASSSVVFLGQTGFIHYLPLFMKCALRHKENDPLVHSLVSRLTPPANYGMLHWHDDFGSLSADQRDVVARFLDFLVKCRGEYFVPQDEGGELLPPSQALQGFWAQFIRQS